MPSECAGAMLNHAPDAIAMPSEASTLTAPMAFHFNPAPRRPAKNWLPYWMPIPYRNITSPMELTSAGGAAAGAMAPIARPANSTAPMSSEKPATEMRPAA